LGATNVRVVEMEFVGNSEGRIVRKGIWTLPSSAWNELPASIPVFVSAIREAMAAAGIAARSVVACMPRRLVTVRFARLPHAPPEQMRNMVGYEAQQYILFPLDEVVLDYHVVEELGGYGEEMQTVLLAAARRSLVTDLVAIFDKAGLELKQLT